MKGEPNQSSLLPSSSTDCSAARPTAMVAMPNQSPSRSNPSCIGFGTGSSSKRLEADDGSRTRLESAAACSSAGHADARSWFIDKPGFAETTAFRNSSLQGAYFIMAARAIGLDCGPMSGFDNEAVDREFFPGGQIKSNFICAIGYGDPAGSFERLPRPDINEVGLFV